MSERSERMELPSSALLAALRASRYPNCTLYLIWHYLERGDVALAEAEYRRDSDKLGCHRKTVEAVLAANAEAHASATEGRR